TGTGALPFVLGGANQASQPSLTIMTRAFSFLARGQREQTWPGGWTRTHPVLVAESTILTLPSYLAGMIRLHTVIEAIALRVLARDGIAAIWQLQVAAGIAYRTGNPGPAASIMEIAEASDLQRQSLALACPATTVDPDTARALSKA